MKRFIPVVIAIGITFILFWKVFLRGLVPIPSDFMVSWYEPWKTDHTVGGVPTLPHKAVGDDIFRQIYPMKTLADDYLSAGQIPLWNPYNGAGQPLLATLHTGITNPFSILLQMGHRTGWTWFVILQVPLLFLAMYWYMRTLTVSRYGAAFAGVVLTLSSVVTARTIYGDYIYALAGLPVLLGIAERMRTAKQSRALYAVAPVTAFVLVSVQPQISLYVCATACIYALVRLGNRAVEYVGMMVLGAGIAALQLLPTYELYRNANVTGQSSAFIFEKFLVPVSHLISFIIPNYFGNQGTYNFWGHTDYVETAAGIGSVPILLALIGIFTRKQKSNKHLPVRFMVWGAVVTVLLTLHWQVPRMLAGLSLPVVSTSIPTRIYLLTVVCIAGLAGFGVDRWRNQQSGKRLKFSVVVPVVFVLMVCAAVVFGTWWLGKTRGISCPSQLPGCVSIGLRNSILEFGVAAGGAVVLFMPLLLHAVSRVRRIASAGLLIVCIAAGSYNAWKFLPFSRPEFVGAPHPVLTQLSALAPGRVAGVGAGAFATDLATQYRYFDTNYYDPLYIRRYGELVSYVNTGDREEGITRSDVTVVSEATVSAELSLRRERYWDLTGTVALVSKTNDPDICRPADLSLSVRCETVWEDNDWRIVRRETALPRAYLVTDVRTDPDPEHLLAQLFSPQTDVAKTAFTELPVSGVDIGRAATESAVESEEYDADRVLFTVTTDIPSFLVLSDTWYPGWRAAIDGEDVPVYRTNYAFRGVAVPRGTHQVEFRYDPDSFRYGAGISAISVLVWLGTVAMRKRTGKKK